MRNLVQNVTLPEGEGGVYVVQLGRFRGQIEPEEAGFFVRSFDTASGRLSLSDASEEILDVGTLHASPRDGALLCRIKRDLRPEGLLARFHHAAQAELLNAVEEGPGVGFLFAFVMSGGGVSVYKVPHVAEEPS